MPEKPKCPLIGQNGNIFNLMGIASKTLKRNGMSNDAKEMCDRITSSASYDEALSIIDEYVEITSADDVVFSAGFFLPLCCRPLCGLACS